MKPNAQVVLKSIEKTSQPLLRKAVDLDIKTKEDYELAGKLISQLKDMAKQAKAEERKITDPLNEALTATRKHFKPFFTAVESTEAEIKERMLAFLSKQEEKANKLGKQLEDGKIKKLSTYASKVNDLHVSNEHASVRNVKVVEIVKESTIPREYLVPDLNKIKAALVEGKKVPGCILTTKQTIAI